jgi:hypothetical protein
MVPFSFKTKLSYSRGMKKVFIRYDPGPWVQGAMPPSLDYLVIGSMASIIDRHAGGPYGSYPPPRWPQLAHYAASDLRLF